MYSEPVTTVMVGPASPVDFSNAYTIIWETPVLGNQILTCTR